MMPFSRFSFCFQRTCRKKYSLVYLLPSITIEYDAQLEEGVPGCFEGFKEHSICLSFLVWEVIIGASFKTGKYERTNP